MRIKIGNISKVIALLVFVFGVVFGIIYLKITIPSERELWRITDNNISDPIIVNELLLFEGDMGEFPSSCEYIYAVNKNAGDVAWSSESFTDHYSTFAAH